MPHKIIYRSQNDVAGFDLERFKESLKKYDVDVKDEAISQALAEYDGYDPLHVSCLVEAGASVIPNEDKAKQYYADHSEWFNMNTNFEHLRRITGYLVGTLDRWNDGKKAEEHDRVKHNVTFESNAKIGQFNQEDKAEIESKKMDEAVARQHDCNC